MKHETNNIKHKLIFASLIILFNFVFIIVDASKVQAVTCAPGDVIVDVCVNSKTSQKTIIKSDPEKECTEKGGTPDQECLYGSDVVPGAFGDPISDPRANIRMAINVAMGFLGVLVAGMIVYGGVMWLTAAGKEDQITRGKHVLMWAAIGAIVISIAWTITSYVLQIGKTIG